MRKSDRARGRSAHRRTRCSSRCRSPRLVLGLLASSIMTKRVLRPLARARARRRGGSAKATWPCARASTGARRDRRSSRASSTPWPSGSDEVPPELARRAARGAASRRRRRSTAFPIRCSWLRSSGELRHANKRGRDVRSKVRAEAGAGALAALEPASARRWSSADREHVAAGTGAYVPQRLDEAIAVAGDDGKRCCCRAPRRSTPRRATSPARRSCSRTSRGCTGSTSSRRPGRDRRARVPHAADVAAHGDPPARRGHRRAADREAGRPACSPRARSAIGCRRSSTSCSICRGSSADRIDLRIAPFDPETLACRGDRRAARARRRAPGDAASEILPGTPRVAVDHDRLQLVFANLIAQRDPPRPRRRHASRSARSARHELVRFEVTDQGPGVPAEYRADDLRQVRARAGRASRRRRARPVHLARDRPGARRPDRRRQRAGRAATARRSGSPCRRPLRSRSACACDTASTRRCRGSSRRRRASARAATTRSMCSRSI